MKPWPSTNHFDQTNKMQHIFTILDAIFCICSQLRILLLLLRKSIVLPVGFRFHTFHFTCIFYSLQPTPSWWAATPWPAGFAGRSSPSPTSSSSSSTRCWPATRRTTATATAPPRPPTATVRPRKTARLWPARLQQLLHRARLPIQQRQQHPQPQ